MKKYSLLSSILVLIACCTLLIVREILQFTDKSDIENRPDSVHQKKIVPIKPDIPTLYNNILKKNQAERENFRSRFKTADLDEQKK